MYHDLRLGLAICEDIGSRRWLRIWRRAPEICSFNGSPFEVGKLHQRLAHGNAPMTGLPLIYVNQIGGQDELVFDGGSFVINGNGALARYAGLAEPRRSRVDSRTACSAALGDEDWSSLSRPGAVYHAMMLDAGLRREEPLSGRGARDVRRIDSALTAAVAVDALGPDRVRGVRLPSRFTSREATRRIRRACWGCGWTRRNRSTARSPKALAGVRRSRS
jgi:NAD+ synthase